MVDHCGTALADFLPLVLGLSPGAIAGILSDTGAPSTAPEALLQFGPWISTEPELRRAAFRPPPRVVVTLAPDASLASDAALATFAGRGVAVVLLSARPGTLVRLCDRVGVPGPDGPMWVPVEEMRQRRFLAIRLGGGGREEWIRLPLQRGPPEVALADVRARGLRVAESRVEYDWSALR